MLDNESGFDGGFTSGYGLSKKRSGGPVRRRRNTSNKVETVPIPEQMKDKFSFNEWNNFVKSLPENPENSVKKDSSFSFIKGLSNKE
jgi:hypothetical protein